MAREYRKKTTTHVTRPDIPLILVSRLVQGLRRAFSRVLALNTIANLALEETRGRHWRIHAHYVPTVQGEKDPQRE